jgi:hypothetical protein
MRLLDAKELGIIRLSLGEDEWHRLTNWYENKRHYSKGKADTFEVHHYGFTITELPDDKIFDRIRGIETALGHVVSVWTCQCLDSIFPFYIEVAGSPTQFLYSKMFFNRKSMMDWLEQDQPFSLLGYPLDPV